MASGMVMLLLVCTSVFSIAFVFLSWHRDRLKGGHGPEALRAMRLAALCSILTATLASYTQYAVYKQGVALRHAQLQLLVLQKLADFRVDIMDNYWSLWRHTAVIYNYSEYERVRQDDGASIPAWSDVSGAENIQELSVARTIFENQQKIARQVLMQDITYPGAVPSTFVEWANITLGIQFEDLPKYINAYHLSDKISKYSGLTGRAVRSATDSISLTTQAIVQ